ncbi:uncharacterized protein LOC105662859 isoform X2 [Megachile rotundata]|uniref:uncharacterized protein LOC105662859 isoform X2 n=1 Tax=Megachile rotundata TaxID=143995 RepID=UPI003FD37E6B
MAKWILVLSVAVLTRNGMADILVQPGYQPQQHHSIITQPPETMQYVNKDHPQQPKSADYHLEFHPVYTDSYHVPADALHPLLQHYQLIPQNYNQLNPGQVSDFGIVGMPAPASADYVPLPVHSRNRRSVEPSAAGQRQKRDKLDAVATKSSLDENISPVIDLQSLDGESTKEKNVKVRQSDNQPMTDSLLGLNPSNMYPMYQEYRVMEPALDSNQEITSKQTPSETNAEETVLTQPASQYPEVSSTPIQPPQIKLENLQHAMLLQQPAPQQHQTEVLQGMEQRNFPDPRPSSAVSQSKEGDVNHNQHRQARTHGTKVIGLSKTNKLMIGNYGGLHHTKLVKGHHSHAVIGTFKQASDTSDPSGDFNAQDDAISNNLVGNSGQQVVQVYQLPNGQAVSYLPSTQYTMLPQTYSSNYVVNYGSSYPCSSSSYRICVHTSGDEPIRMYQLP